jgi:predicted metal-dependent phosphoesterase TrpH
MLKELKMETQTSNRFWRIFLAVIFPVIILMNIVTNDGCNKAAFRIEDPYADMDWSNDGQYKANFHTHTTVGEASAEPESVINDYKSKGYSILALTDHDNNGPVEPTWPWPEFDKGSQALTMVAIKGNEISEIHHMVSLFNDFGDSLVPSENKALEEIGDRDGLAVFNHPGRYEKSVEWYTDMYRRYDHLIGLEVYNKRDRYPGDRKTWDAILTQLVPERAVWGLANDDMHKPDEDLGFSWNVILLPELTRKEVRRALERGRFYFVHSPLGPTGPAVPVIESIQVNEQLGTIDLQVSGHDSITWISQGNIVHTGNRLNLVELADVDKYVRAEICGPDNITIGTQPFLIERPPKNYITRK